MTATENGQTETEPEQPPQTEVAGQHEKRGLLVPLYIAIVAISMVGWLFALIELAATAIRRLLD
jgi:hypothetical protein